MSELWSWTVEPLDCRMVLDAESGLVVADVRVPLSEGCAKVSALMAAAPDMKRALIALLSYCATNNGSNYTPAQSHDVFAAARAAVKRAEPPK